MDRQTFVNGNEIIDYWGYLTSVRIEIHSISQFSQCIDRYRKNIRFFARKLRARAFVCVNESYNLFRLAMQ